MCSLHFPGGRKTSLNLLPTIVPKAKKPSQTKTCPTEKERIRTPFVRITKRLKPSKLFSPTEIDNDPIELPQQADEAIVDAAVRTEELATLNDEMFELLRPNKKSRLENQQLKVENEQMHCGRSLE